MNGQMETSIQDIGKIPGYTVKGHLYGMAVTNIPDNLKMAKLMAKGPCSTPMVIIIRVIGK